MAQPFEVPADVVSKARSWEDVVNDDPATDLLRTKVKVAMREDAVRYPGIGHDFVKFDVDVTIYNMEAIELIRSELRICGWESELRSLPFFRRQLDVGAVVFHRKEKPGADGSSA